MKTDFPFVKVEPKAFFEAVGVVADLQRELESRYGKNQSTWPKDVRRQFKASYLASMQGLTQGE